ncbi:outer membrane protein assembly factor BamB family protein [Stieleria varia]|uniref:Outer membrane biogenesis protein BamB n=1 Tax=Stieleria varia TaxID=2528005 RepID=A0A5C6AW52_9BACT|nr:PQQ-binding-like beta-propeller repeat protein [Stieleria varia]TWU04255.1 outer membrane biogenesis protein BamB [Stieleria varia]
MSRISIAVGLLLLAGMGQAEDWPRFRGPDGRGVVASDLPTTWSETENLAWKTRLPGKGSSSPVTFADRVFLTAYSGYAVDEDNPGDRTALKLHVLCLSLSDGKLLWDQTISPSPAEQDANKRVIDHGYASPTPCVDADGVYASFGPSGVVAFSHSGEQIWRQEVGTNTAGFGAAASPIVFNDLVIMNASIEDGSVYGMEKSSGKIRWKTDGITKAWTTPTLVQTAEGSTEMVLNQQNAILGLDPATGSKLWSCDAIEDYVVPCVVAEGETLYCSGGRENKTFVIKSGGRGDVSESHLVWEASRGANVTSPVLVAGHLYWSHDKSIALCVRASDGEEVFRERMPTRSRVYASIVSDGKHLFLTTRDAGVLVLAAEPTYREIAINHLGTESERFNATPAIADDRLLIRSDQYLYCVAKPNK